MIRMSLEVGHFAPYGEESHVSLSGRSVPGSNPGKRCPGLTSSFTPYYFEIVKNAVVWKYFVWSKAERQSGSNP